MNKLIILIPFLIWTIVWVGIVWILLHFVLKFW